jgi:signal transduction histidine kinase
MSVAMLRRLSPRRLPLTVSLPLFVALAMFVVAVGTTQIGVRALSASNEAALRNQAVVFLDAVAGGIAARIDNGADTVRSQLASYLTYRTALLEKAMAVRWSDGEGGWQSVVLDEEDRAMVLAALDIAETLAPDQTRIWDYPENDITLVLRTYQFSGQRFALAATFDTSTVTEAQKVAFGVAIGIDILVAILAAIAVYAVTRRALAPLDSFIMRLAAEEGPNASQSGLRRGDELRRLEAALALREKSEAERAQVLSSVAQQERDALLARMAAAVAHEVRNPLAGLMNGVSTMKRFGDKPEVREQTLKLLEQGLDSIRRVVEVTLSTYRRR